MGTAWLTVKNVKFQNYSAVRPGSNFSTMEASREPTGKDMKPQRGELTNNKLNQKIEVSK